MSCGLCSEELAVLRERTWVLSLTSTAQGVLAAFQSFLPLYKNSTQCVGISLLPEKEGQWL